jgi:hypothetical protein
MHVIVRRRGASRDGRFGYRTFCRAPLGGRISMARPTDGCKRAPQAGVMPHRSLLPRIVTRWQRGGWWRRRESNLTDVLKRPVFRSETACS